MGNAVGLRPLSVQDAEVMSRVLADPSLYEFTGGEPPSVAELERRYTIQARGYSSDGSEEWINLVVMRLPDEQPIGYVQATVPKNGEPAEIAWVIGRPWQGHGFATRAAQLLVERLAGSGVNDLVAHIHPDHLASQSIATKLGMAPTAVELDGEIRWLSTSV